MKKILFTLLAVLLAVSCTTPHSGKTIRTPVLYGHSASGSARSLISTQGGLDSQALIPFSLSPVVTAWTTTTVSGSNLSYSIFGQPVTVTTTENSDGSTTFSGTISGTNGSGLADDLNTCVFTVVLKTDNSFTFTQAIWLRVGTNGSPDSDPSDYLNEYMDVTGSGNADTAGGFTATGSEYKADALSDSSNLTPGHPVIHSITFEAKSNGSNVAILTDTDYYVTDSSTPTWPTSQNGVDSAFESANPAPTSSTAGVTSQTTLGWYFVGTNSMLTAAQALGYSQSGGFPSWGALTSNGTTITQSNLQSVYSNSLN